MLRCFSMVFELFLRLKHRVANFALYLLLSSRSINTALLSIVFRVVSTVGSCTLFFLFCTCCWLRFTLRISGNILGWISFLWALLGIVRVAAWCRVTLTILLVISCCVMMASRIYMVCKSPLILKYFPTNCARVFLGMTRSFLMSCECCLTCSKLLFTCQACCFRCWGCRRSDRFLLLDLWGSLTLWALLLQRQGGGLTCRAIKRLHILCSLLVLLI